jgi:hypothetical protein
MIAARTRVIAVLMALTGTLATAQAPTPFPKPTTRPAPPPAAPSQPPVAPQATQPTKPAATAAPTEKTLGVPVYPGATFITSYDAGRGQRFYLFGVAASYADIVTYYRTTLKQRGTDLFESPATHQFEVGRFREETMAFPPGVTVKDFTWGGSAGYPNPKPGAQPTHFPTVIQIVPVSEKD